MFNLGQKTMPAKLYRVHLTNSEREELNLLIQTRSQQSQRVKRAYVLLAADEDGEKGWKDEQIRQAYGVSVRSIERLRERFVVEGLTQAIEGKKREVFREKLFTGEVEAKLVALRCSEPPSGYCRWSLQLLADKMIELNYVESISHESVRQLLKKRHQTLAGEKLGDS